MTRIFIIIGLFASFVFLPSCKKSVQDPTYTGESRIFLVGPSLGANINITSPQTYNAVDFSFSTVPSSKTDTIITLTAQVVGGVVDYDRKFAVTVDTSSRVFPEEYELVSDFKIPAHSFQGKVGVKVKRSARLGTETAKLVVRIVPTKDFVVNDFGLNNPRPNTSLQTSFAITWTSLLTKPVNWDAQFGMWNFIGLYSKTKHQLIIDLTPYPNFELFLTTNAYNRQKYAIQGILADYVSKYNLANPGNPLRNENGVAIGICNNCP